MRVIVVGAEGRVGWEILSGIAAHRFVTRVVSLSDGPVRHDLDPEREVRIEQRAVDLLGDLADELRYADAVVYMSWAICGSSARSRERDLAVLSNVCEATRSVGARALLYGSSTSAYSHAPPGQAVDESWPTHGLTDFLPSLQMAEGERVVEHFAADNPLIRVALLRSGVIASPSPLRGRWRERIGARLFRVATEGRWLRIVPDPGPYALQCVHVSDFVRALCLVLTQPVAGAFNVAADPITPKLLARRFEARTLAVAPHHVFRALRLASRLRLFSMPPDQLELALRSPVVDTTRAQCQLGWAIEHPAASIVAKWIEHLESVCDRQLAATAKCGSNNLEAHEVADLRPLYLQSLEYFGDKVHAIGDDQWDRTGAGGSPAWQLVAVVARTQYRVALVADGHDQDRVEAELPSDPLGFMRADGWDLAAERGALAVTASDGPGHGDPLGPTLARLLPGVIRDTVESGVALGRIVGLEDQVPAALRRFVRERTEQEVGAEAS